MSTARKLISVNGLILTGLGFGFLNNVAITAVFGLNRSVDAYFAAMLIPLMFQNLVIDYLGKNFLPVYAKRFKQSPDDAFTLASSIVTVVVILSLVVAAIFWVLADPLYSALLRGFSQEDIKLVVEMFRMMSPVVVLMSLERVLQYIWQHDEKYIRVTFFQLFVPLTILVFILAGSERFGVYALPMGFLTGHLITAIGLTWRAPYRYRPSLGLSDENVRIVLRNSAMLMASGSIARVRELVVMFFASSLGEGAISAIAIARKFCEPMSEATLRGVRMIIFSHSAKEVAENRSSELGKLYNFAVAAIMLGLIPVTVWLMLDGRQVVEALFMRGEFTTDMAATVTIALLGMAPSIPLQGINQVLSNCFYALGRVIVPMLLMPVGTLVYVALAWWLSGNFGLLGLTAAASVVALGTSIALIAFLRIELASLSFRFIALSIARYMVMALLAVFAAIAIRETLPISMLASLLVTMLIIAITYVAAAFVFRDRTAREIWQHIRNGLGASSQA